MTAKKEFIVQIKEEDAAFILDINAHFLNVAKRTVFCGICTPKTQRSVGIKEYTMFVNDLGDIILRGRCDRCGEAVARYIESGETPSSFKRAMKVIAEKRRSLREQRRKRIRTTAK